MLPANIPSGWVDINTTNDVPIGFKSSSIRCNGVGGQVKFMDKLNNVHTWDIAKGETIVSELAMVYSTANGTTATLLAVSVL